MCDLPDASISCGRTKHLEVHWQIICACEGRESMQERRYQNEPGGSGLHRHLRRGGAMRVQVKTRRTLKSRGGMMGDRFVNSSFTDAAIKHPTPTARGAIVSGADPVCAEVQHSEDCARRWG